MRGQRHVPVALYPRERPGTHCTGCWVGPGAGLDRCAKSRHPPGFDHRTVQPVTSRCNDWATLVADVLCSNLERRGWHILVSSRFPAFLTGKFCDVAFGCIPNLCHCIFLQSRNFLSYWECCKVNPTNESLLVCTDSLIGQCARFVLGQCARFVLSPPPLICPLLFIVMALLFRGHLVHFLGK